MEKLERVKAALRSEAVDRPPYSFWTHLPGIDLDPLKLADETAAFQRRYDLDFVKAMSNGLYCVEDWGAVCDYSEIEHGGVARVVQPAVDAVDDWSALAHLDPTRGAFGRELEHLERLVRQVGPRVPVLATVFSPLTIAAKLSNGASRRHLEHHADAVLRALQVITDVSCAFTREALARGCAGIFLALQDATRELFDEASYLRFGEPFDRAVLEAARAAGGWFNAVHLHGEHVLFDLVARYEVDALNWHIGETPPSIEAYRRSGGARPVLGGLKRAHITRCERDGIREDIDRALAQTGGRGLLLAPACVIRHPVDHDTLLWTAQTIKAASAKSVR
jgi:uroporphyrinogen decarboxylase